MQIQLILLFWPVQHCLLHKTLYIDLPGTWIPVLQIILQTIERLSFKFVGWQHQLEFALEMTRLSRPTKKGSVRIQTLNDSKFRDFTLTDVLYAKELGTNLISTQKLGLKGCKTILNPYNQGADIFDKNDNWLGTANIIRSMYYLQILKIISSS